MKQMYRLLALLLCGAVVLSLCACTKKPDPVKPTDPTVATDAPAPDDPGLQLYQTARAAVDSAQDVSLRISVKKSIAVGGETFEESSDQTLIYKGLGTSSFRAYCEDLFGISTREYYSNNTVYLVIDDLQMTGSAVQNMKYSCEEDTFLASHYPAVMLDASLYQSITVTEGEKLTTLTMSEPTAAESWALPEGAKFLSASGTARIDSSGNLHSTVYTVTYQYGNCEIALEVKGYLSLTPDEFELPEQAQSFPKIANVDAVKLQYRALQHLTDVSKLSATSRDFYYSAASQFEVDYVSTNHFNATDRMFRRYYKSVYVDYAAGEQESYDYEDFYMNKLYHIVKDDQDSLQGTISLTEASYYCRQEITGYIQPYYAWETATVTDLGSTYLIEYTYNDAVAVALAEAACDAIYDDPKALEDISEKHKTVAVSGYLAVDKYCGLPTATGISYMGSYIAGRYEYPLLVQVNIAIDAPALGVYKAITKEMPAEKEPETPATPLFYHVTGDDGQEMWLLGTVHVGDEHTAYLPQEIYDAFEASDALAMEFDIAAFEAKLETDEALQEAVTEYYLYADGSNTADHLSRGVYNDAVKFLKASGNYHLSVEYMKPYFWSSMLDNFILQQGHQLTADQGVEMRLTDLAQAQGKTILEVESAQSQLAMFSDFSDELQEFLLEEMMSTDPIAAWEELHMLYEAWCSGDEEVLRTYLSTDPETLEQMTDEERALYKEYNDAINRNRNREMLEVAKSYLESGDTVFFAVGLAHLLVDEGLVEALQDAGYNVEQVTYAQ